MRHQPPENRDPLQPTQRLHRLFVRITDAVGRVDRCRRGSDRTLDAHNRAVGKRVPAHDTLTRSLAQRELHPEVCKAEQVVRREHDGRVVAKVGERSRNRIEPVGDAPHRPTRVVVEPVVECADRRDVREDWGREEVCVT